MSGELVEYKTNKGVVKLSKKDVLDYLVSGRKEYVTDVEVMAFMNMCYYQKLNPWLREAYIIKYSKDQPASLVTGKDVFFKRACHNPKFRGHQAEAIEDKDGNLIGAWAEVYVEDYKVPVRVVVDFKEYVQYTKTGQPNRFWREKPKTMIRKVALAQALREAFPEDFEGLYAPEEMPIEMDKLSEKPVKKREKQSVENAVFEEEKPKPVKKSERKPAPDEKIKAEHLAGLKKLAKEVGYKNPALHIYKTEQDYKDGKSQFEEMKELILTINVMRHKRVMTPEEQTAFMAKHNIKGWDKLLLPPLRLQAIVKELEKYPLSNEIEKDEIPESLENVT